MTSDRSAELEHRRTKIVATIGPACWSPEGLDALIAAGANVIRIALAYGDHADHERLFKRVRAASERAGRYVGIIGDLSGPKIRAGTFEGGALTLTAGEKVVVTTRDVLGKAGLIPCRYAALAGDVEPGNQIMLYDGRVGLRVERISGQDIECEVELGGVILDGKGLNLPRVAISAPTVTDKDRADARFMIGLGVDFLALSFVREAADLHTLRRIAQEEGAQTPIIAKIEKPEALDNIDAIIGAADGIMVARGDLGVEMPAERLPVIQNELVRMALEANKPVIMATQMLESMIERPCPTRAEVTDVASAVFAGTDAVMLSGETANGDYATQAVETMDRIVREIEGYQYSEDRFDKIGRNQQRPTTADDHHSAADLALSHATALLSRELGVRYIAVPVRGGRTAFWVSAARPAANVIALTSDDRVCRRSALHWGLHARRVTKQELSDVHQIARKAILELDPEAKGDLALLVWDAQRGDSAEKTSREPTVSILSV